MKQAQNHVAVSVDTKHQTMGGLQFPLTVGAESAIGEMAARALDYVQFSVNTQREQIELEDKCRACDVAELPAKGRRARREDQWP